MVSPQQPRRRPVLSAAISVAVAAALLAVATVARLALGPLLGDIAAPFMLYVAAVLAAGLIRGAFCGGIVLILGGLIGVRLFLSDHGVPRPGAIVSLMLFWAVSALVLVTANELRVQLTRAMQRLSDALERRRAA